MPHPADERRHAPGPGAAWEESWYIDFTADSGRIGGFVRLGLRPAEGVAWWWAYLVRAGQPLVAVRDHEVELPRGNDLEVRASGLWAALHCETALEHWSIGMEAFGVALDDPLDSWRGELGHRVAVGLDLEWEAGELALGRVGRNGYDQGGSVHGDVLIGSEKLAIDGFGVRARDWGDRDWGARDRGGPDQAWAAVRLSDGNWVRGDARHVGTGPDGLVAGVRPTGGAPLWLTPVAHAPVAIPGQGRLARALCGCRYGDRQGWGWAEYLQV